MVTGAGGGVSARPRGHVLTLTGDDYGGLDDWTLECDNPDVCGGWLECPEVHEVDGWSADAGPHSAGTSTSCPWFGRDEFTFHGVAHTWMFGHGWTVPYPGCVVADAGSIGDEAADIFEAHGVGRFVVDDDWGDTTCWLEVVDTIECGRVDDE